MISEKMMMIMMMRPNFTSQCYLSEINTNSHAGLANS
jgi:hypothetical protein